MIAPDASLTCPEVIGLSSTGFHTSFPHRGIAGEAVAPGRSLLVSGQGAGRILHVIRARRAKGGT